MAYVTESEIEKARKLDLFSYLQVKEPHELVRCGRDEYCTKTHDSLRISNGKWFWWSRGIGGVSALDYLIKVKGIDFVSSVTYLNGVAEIPHTYVSEKKVAQKIYLPPCNYRCQTVKPYLLSRGIDGKIVDIFIENKQIAEDSETGYALFFGKAYRTGSEKTLKSIQITLMSKLEKFNLDSLSFLTEVDELDLRSMGEKKVALFALIPDNDTSFNFLVSILYTQLFQQLFYVADHIYGGSLPVPVHFMMDEFANVALPDDFEKILSVMRSRNVSVSIILQNLSQLKALFEKQWESIVGNCDEFVYLGGNEQSTHKYVSELIGKETIDTNSFGKSDGMRGNFSTNYQLAGRELLTPDEVRMLDNRYAIVLIRGERPVMDVKYDIFRHPNISLSAIGGGEVYRHGKERLAACGITIVNLADYPGKQMKDFPLMESVVEDIEAYDQDELEIYINLKEQQENEKKK